MVQSEGTMYSGRARVGYHIPQGLQPEVSFIPFSLWWLDEFKQQFIAFLAVSFGEKAVS